MQYNDDDSLIAFANAYNLGTQEYVDWFNEVNLPVYTQLVDSLLDWVAAGLYGIVRPQLSSGRFKTLGPLNTASLNTVVLNESKKLSKFVVTSVSDDVFQRVITWHFFKGDGKYFTIDWLKRRIYRFLYGTNGTDAVAPYTNQISVEFGIANQINVTIISGLRVLTQSATLNSLYKDRAKQGFVMNGRCLNQGSSTFFTFTEPAFARIFKEAVDCGVLEMPFQYSVVVVIGA